MDQNDDYCSVEQFKICIYNYRGLPSKCPPPLLCYDNKIRRGGGGGGGGGQIDSGDRLLSRDHPRDHRHHN